LSQTKKLLVSSLVLTRQLDNYIHKTETVGHVTHVENTAM